MKDEIKEGIYNQILNNEYKQKLKEYNNKDYFIKNEQVGKEEAAGIISSYLAGLIQKGLNLSTKGNEDKIESQISLSNKIINLLKNELNDNDFDDALIDFKGNMLKAFFNKINSTVNNYENFIKEITPHTGLINSSLFTGNSNDRSLESEIKKEILSSNEISFLVSFIKWGGVRLIYEDLKAFTQNGGKLKIITTTYMGVTDPKAVKLLSELPNTEIKVSYNLQNNRLHAKSYLFLRDSGFHTAYIGSSNISNSALTKGLEWNLKITTKEIPHIIDKFKKTFEVYWEDPEFEIFKDFEDHKKLCESLKKQKISEKNTNNLFFDLRPFNYQEEILEKLKVEREIRGRYRNLIVAATGTGKTVIAAFDFYEFYKKNPNCKLLYVAHRKEILMQARATFQGVIRDYNFGELWFNGEEPEKLDNIFASVLTLNNKVNNLNLSEDYFDFIIIDEVHHIAAKSYRPILDKFKPKILLGLTATPERMDGEDILSDFDGVIASEIRLFDALNNDLLAPFNYFGITDSVDLKDVTWKNGRYVPGELTNIYTQNDLRVGYIIEKCSHYLDDFQKVKALGFCVTIEHAKYMSEKFKIKGLKADCLVSENNQERDILRNKLIKGEINYLFVVDIFNEGVDIPEIDTVLFLRPTESLTIFLQQLGRGLRKSKGKEVLTVLDFVGNSRTEYDFERKFRAMIGKTNNSTIYEIQNEFPHLPFGCSIILEKKAKEFILNNISNTTNQNQTNLISKIINFQYQSNKEFNLNNFLTFYALKIEIIYKNNSWSYLCYKAKRIDSFSDVNEKQMINAIFRKWLVCDSISYLRFILELAKNEFKCNRYFTAVEERMLLMLHYDFWGNATQEETLFVSIEKIGNNKLLVKEMIEFLEIKINSISHFELDINLQFEQPLKVHSRYTREQVLAAFGVHTLNRKDSNREGVLFVKNINTEILFTTLEKSDDQYSPTTLYNDYAVNEKLFHWQSQNATKPDSPKGKSYINHKEQGKTILLFVRERNLDEFQRRMGYVFIGEVNYTRHEGSKPMNIWWELSVPFPHSIWNEVAKVSLG